MPSRSELLPVSGVILAASAIIMLPGLLSGPNFDASVFLLIGERLLDGHLPYVDLWDHKPPGIYVIDTALILLLGWLVGAWPAVWVGSVGATAFLGLAVFAIGRERHGTLVATVAGLLTATTAAAWPFSLGGGLTETFAAALVAGAWWLAARQRHWITVGLLLALAGATSLFAIPGAAVVVGVALRLGGRPAARRVLLAAVAGASAMILAAGAAGILGAMLDALVRYNAAYRAASLADPLPESLAISPRLIGWYAANGLALLTAAIIGSLRRSPCRWAAILAVVGTAAMIVFGARLYGHYLLLVMVPAGVLATAGLSEVARWARGRVRRLVVAVGATVILAVTAAAGYAAVLSSAPDAFSLRDRDMAATQVIRARAPGANVLLVWGNAPTVYLHTGAEPAWRYVYLLPLLTPGYVSPDLVATLVADLEAEPPCHILDAGSPAPGQAGLPPLLIDRPLTPSERRVDLLDPVRAFARQNYIEVTEVMGWPLYERRGGCQAPLSGRTR